MLTSPNNVNLVLQQLEFFYGRPELIIESLSTEIRRVKPIPESRPEYIINLHIKVQNLVTFIESLSNSQIYLYDFILCKEIISKLPRSKLEQWVIHSFNISQQYSLKDLSDWIMIEAQYISLIVPSFSKRPEINQTRNTSSRRSKMKTSKNFCPHGMIGSRNKNKPDINSENNIRLDCIMKQNRCKKKNHLIKDKKEQFNNLQNTSKTRNYNLTKNKKTTK